MNGPGAPSIFAVTTYFWRGLGLRSYFGSMTALEQPVSIAAIAASARTARGAFGFICY
ncbi:hypothetical protein [Lysobacter gummosus]|uniref:hypothetical protein n=1 Tax=Lysobacter gummosus TaxID=262324 RepID=UPI00363E6388